MRKSKNNKVLTIICLITLAAFVFSGCAEKPKAEEVSTVYIGFTGPLSGGMAKFGQNIIDGMNIAIDEINAKGLVVAGKKYRLEVKAFDDKYTPNEAATNARRLVQEFKTPVIICAHSGGTKAMMQFNQQEGFIACAYTTDTTIEELDNKLLVRIAGPYINYLTPGGYVDIGLKNYGKKLAGVPGISEYAKNWADLFYQKWKEAGGELLGNFPVDYQKEADFYTPVSKALALKPDLLFIGGSSEPTALVIKQARELGYKGGFIVLDQAKIEEIQRILPLSDLEGYIGANPHDILINDENAYKIIGRTNKGGKLFIEKYKQKYPDKEVTAEQAYNYTLMHMFAKAMELSGSVTDVQAIHNKLPEAIKSLPDEFMARPTDGITTGGGLINVSSACLVKDGKIESYIVLPPQEYMAKKKN